MTRPGSLKGKRSSSARDAVRFGLTSTTASCGGRGGDLST
jgi:hypothetical protein